MILDDICNSRVYSSNAFYVLGLTVDMTSKKIRHRQEDVIDGCATLGEKAWHAEFDKYLLGSSAVPEEEVAKNLFEQLKDPERFATEMFFWFWPKSEISDSALTAITKGERDVAVRLWQSEMNKAGERGIVARHNLAVIFHFYAIDGEDNILHQSEVVDDNYRKAVNRYWKSSFELWEDLSDDDLFWDVFTKRVAMLKDPRLDENFIEEFRERFPICFDNINADYLIEYARAGKTSDAKRHFDYIVSTMSGVDDVEETMERTFNSMVNKVRALIKQCETTKDHKKVLGICKEILDSSKKLASIFKVLVPDGNAYTNGILNEVVWAILHNLPTYSRETGDYEHCLPLAKDLLLVAATPLLEEKVKIAINEWNDLVQQEREACTCCVCGTYKKGIGTTTIKMHNNVCADPVVFGRVQWRTRTISNVPVCSSCRNKFKPENSMSFTPVKNSLAEGWKFGDKPSQTEMDLASIL